MAADAGRSLISLSLSWLLHHAGVDCMVLGASRMEQLAANLEACGEGPLPPAGRRLRSGMEGASAAGRGL